MLTDLEMLATLRCHPLFEGMAEGSFQEVCRLAIQRRLDSGECLLHQGKPADRFYILIQGQMKLTRVLMEGQEKLVEIIQPGQSFGEALLFSGEGLNAFTASALKASSLVSLDGLHYRRMLESQPHLCLNLLGRFSQRMGQFLDEIDTLAMANASQRVARFLNQELQSGANLVQLHVPKRLIASQLGIQPETFSRILHRLMDAGIIAMERRNIRVLDTPALTGFIQ